MSFCSKMRYSLCGLFSTCGILALGFSLCIMTAAATVPSSKRFDLTQPSYDLFRSKALHDVTVQQGFAFDNVNHRLFVSQLRYGSAATSGDLVITELDFAGKQLGYMYLTGFGHGIAFGAQAVGSSTYLWTETDADSGGYGQKLSRFKFTSGTTLSKTSSALTVFTPVSAATQHTCSIDPVTNHLIVRYQMTDGKHIAVYDLAAATAGNFSAPLAHFRQPALDSLSSTFQGYTAYGEYLYVLTGTSYSESDGVVNSQVTSINLNTGTVEQGPILSKAGSTLSYREPEGLAIYKTLAGEIRLFLGFASGNAGDRRSNIFYKNALV